MIRTHILPAIIFLLLLNSCVSPEKLRKETVYFNEGLDTAKLSTYIFEEPVIQKGDVLQVNIASKSSSANQLFNLNFSPGTIGSGNAGSNGGGTATGTGGSSNSYVVDVVTGEIKLPLLGIIHADGMTKQKLEQEIIRRAADYLKEDPIVNVRYLNFQITFQGLVGNPGTVTFPSERVTFLDALGKAGGIAPGGDLKNILIIREQNGKRTMHTVDLTKGDIFNSSNYYLKQNDFVYVKPTDKALVATDQSVQRRMQYVSFGLSFVNIVFLISNFFR